MNRVIRYMDFEEICPKTANTQHTHVSFMVADPQRLRHADAMIHGNELRTTRGIGRQRCAECKTHRDRLRSTER